ncbi:rCG39695 [Rattus norvegicus]|uniref:RCG39695 n=1 Tax=Rattus norvegicus TaxID=10116 RepID=A6I6G4_RAT|nr:rCG39695 [Rattus norvegicus]
MCVKAPFSLPPLLLLLVFCVIYLFTDISKFLLSTRSHPTPYDTTPNKASQSLCGPWAVQAAFHCPILILESVLPILDNSNGKKSFMKCFTGLHRLDTLCSDL